MLGLRRVWNSEVWRRERESWVWTVIGVFLVVSWFRVNFFVGFFCGIPWVDSGTRGLLYFVEDLRFGVSMADLFLVGSVLVSLVCFLNVWVWSRGVGARWV